MPWKSFFPEQFEIRGTARKTPQEYYSINGRTEKERQRKCPAAGFLYSSGVDVYRTIPKLIPEYSSGIPAQSSTNPLRYET